MANLPNPANIRYGGFYLPVFSLLYIHQEVGLPVDVAVPFLKIVLHEGNFPILLGLTVLGGLIGHGESRSIYGIEGAKKNPKNRWAVLWYRLLFSVKSKPGKPPKTIGDLEEKLENSADTFLELTGLQKVLLTLYRLLRFSVIWPSKLAFLGMALLTTWVLVTTAFAGTLQVLGALLLVAQVVFFFGSWVFNRYPTAVPVNSAPWLYLAEYHKAQHLHQQGDIEFEYGPLQFAQSAIDEFEESHTDSYDHLQYGEEDIDWLVPIEESGQKYLVKLDEKSDGDNR